MLLTIPRDLSVARGAHGLEKHLIPHSYATPEVKAGLPHQPPIESTMPAIQHVARSSAASDISKPTDADALILEAWSQGYMVGSLIIMGALTVANMRRGIILHKLILLEVSSSTREAQQILMS